MRLKLLDKLSRDNSVVAVDKGLPEVGANESVTLRGFPSDKSRTGAWKAAPFIFSLACGETVGHLSVALNLVPYLLINLHGVSDSASTIFTNFMGTCYITPVFWGFLADSYLGRFWTIGLGSIVMLCGLALLTFSTSVSSLQPPPCTPTGTQGCPPADGHVMSAFYAGIYLLAVGSGGIKPCLAPLGADQFDDSVPDEKIQRPLYFNMFFWCVELGALFTLTAIIYIQDILGRTKGFGVPTAIYFVGVCIYFIGTPFYRHKLPAGSGLTRIAQVFVAASRKRSSVTHPANSSLLFETSAKEKKSVTGRKLAHTKAFRFLDRAAIIADGDIAKDGKSRSRWKLCPVTQVEEAKRVMHVMPIWLTTIIPYVLFAQLSSYSVIQTLSMNRHIGSYIIPPASFQSVALFVLCAVLPLYDPFFVPFIRKMTGNPRGLSHLYRIGTGLAMSIISMLSAALVEYRRKRVAKREGMLDNPVAQLPISAFYLVPQIGILGLTEVFLTVGQIEFFYEEMPDGMRTLGNAFYCSAISVGYFITSFLIPTVNKLTRHGAYGGWLAHNINHGDLQNFYWLLVVLSIANLGLFLIAAHLYKYKRLDSGSHAGAKDVPRDSAAARPSDVQLLDEVQYENPSGSGAELTWVSNL